MSKRRKKIRKRYRMMKNKAPGSLDYTGIDEGACKIRFMEYDTDKLVEKDIKSISKLKIDSLENVKWIDIVGLSDPKIIEIVGKQYGIHNLILEDILDTGHRPKLEVDKDFIFLIGKTLDFNSETKELWTSQVSYYLKEDVLITFRESENNVFDSVRKRLKSGKNIRGAGLDYLFYALLDAMVDSYFLILENLDEELDLLEDELMDRPDEDLLHNIYELKREMIYIRNIVWPLRAIIGDLTKREIDLIEDSTVYYLRDIHDHIIQIIDIIETYRDILSGMLDTYLSSIGNRTNDVMKVLTIFSTIFIPLTFLTGLYGTNFPNIPAFRFKYSYPVFIAVNILLAIFTFKYLKKKNWI